LSKQTTGEGITIKKRKLAPRPQVAVQAAEPTVPPADAPLIRRRVSDIGYTVQEYLKKNPNYTGVLKFEGRNTIAVVKDGRVVKYETPLWLEQTRKKVDELLETNPDEALKLAYESGLMSESDYQKSRQELGEIKAYNEKVQKYNALLTTNPEQALQYGLESGLLTRGEYEKQAQSLMMEREAAAFAPLEALRSYAIQVKKSSEFNRLLQEDPQKALEFGLKENLITREQYSALQKDIAESQTKINTYQKLVEQDPKKALEYAYENKMISPTEYVTRLKQLKRFDKYNELSLKNPEFALEYGRKHGLITEKEYKQSLDRLNKIKTYNKLAEKNPDKALDYAYKNKLISDDYYFKMKRDLNYYQQLTKRDPVVALKYARDKKLISEEEYSNKVAQIQKYNALARTNPEKALDYALSAGLITKSQYVEQKKDLKFPVTVTLPDGTTETKVFNTLAEAKAYEKKITTRQDAIKNAILADVGWRGTWESFVEREQKRADKLAELAAAGLIKFDGNTAVLAKPVEVLTREETRKLNEAGFNIPYAAESPAFILYQWATEAQEEAGVPKGTYIRYPEYYHAAPPLLNVSDILAIYGDLLETAALPYRLITALIPGEQPYEKRWRNVTTENLKYLEDVPPERQIRLFGTSLLADMGVSYAMMLPVGLGLKGLTSLSKSLAKQLTIKSPSTLLKMAKSVGAKIPGISKIKEVAMLKRVLQKNPSKAASIVKSFLQKHPKMVTALLWSPAAGIEALNVLDMKARGVPDDEILRTELRRIGKMYAGMKGLKAGFTLLDKKVEAELQKLVEVRKYVKKDGTIGQRLVFKKKEIPEEIAKLFQTEIDERTGEVVLVGVTTDGRLVVPSARKYGKLLNDLMKGKAVSIGKYKEALIKNVGKEGYEVLRARGLNLEKMSPEEVAELAFKELSYGTPWYNAVKNAQFEATTEPATMKIYGSIDVNPPSVEDLGVEAFTRAKDTYNYLLSRGLNSVEAQLFTEQLLKATPQKIIEIAKRLGISPTDKMINALLKESLARSVELPTSIARQVLKDKTKDCINYLKSAGMSAKHAEQFAKQIMTGKPTYDLIKIATKEGLTTSQIVALTLASIGGFSVANTAKAKSLPVTLENAGLDDKQVKQVMKVVLQSKTPEEFVKNLKLASAPAATISVALLDEYKLRDLVPKLDPKTLTKIAPVISEKTLANVLPRLDEKAIDAVAPQLSAETFLNVKGNLTPEQTAKVLPNLSDTTLNEVMKKIKPEELVKTLPYVKPEDIPAVMPHVPPKILPNIIPNLSPPQIFMWFEPTIPNLKSLTKILPHLDDIDIAALIPKLSTKQIEHQISSQPQINWQEIMLKLDTYLINALAGYYPNRQILLIARRAKRKLQEAYRRTRKLKKGKPGYYKVTFFYPGLSPESHRVKAKSFGEALTLGFQARKEYRIPYEVEVRKT